MSYRPYPLFVPPAGVALVDHAVWSRGQAAEYFDWFQLIAESRVDQMAAYFGLTVGARVRSDIVAVSEVASIAFARTPFSEMEAKHLTNQGYALGADLGLLISQVLVRAHPRLTWQCGSGPADYVSKNLPVLTGFLHGVRFDPTLVGTAQAHGVFSGRRGPSAWADAYDAWVEMATA